MRPDAARIALLQDHGIVASVLAVTAWHVRLNCLRPFLHIKASPAELGQATLCKTHRLFFAPGVLNKHIERLKKFEDIKDKIVDLGGLH